MSLVEVSVALVVLSIILAAFGAFLVTAVKVQRSNEYRIKATQVGTQAVERMRALPWDKLGFYADDTVAASTCSASTLVTLPVPAAPATKDAQVPVGGTAQVVQGQVTYTTTTCAYWHDDPTDGIGGADSDGPKDVKRIDVTVAWNNAGALKTLTVSGNRAPTAQEVTPKAGSATTPFGVLSATATPASATIDTSGNTTTTVTFDATTTTGVSVVQLKWSDSTGAAKLANMSANGSTTSWTYSLPTGSGPFTATSTTFTVVAVSATGEQNSQALQVAFSTAASALTIPTLTTTANAVDVTSTGSTTTAFTINATASAPVSSMTVTYKLRTGAMTTKVMTVSGSSGAITFPAGDGPFPDTTVAFTVTANSTIGSASRAIDVTFVPASVIPVEVTAIGISPTLCLSRNTGGNQKVLRASTVTVDVSGVTTADTVTLEFNNTAKSRVDATTKTAISGGARFSYTIPTQWEWSSSDLVVTALATRASDKTQSPVTKSDATKIEYAQNAQKCSG